MSVAYIFSQILFIGSAPELRSKFMTWPDTKVLPYFAYTGILQNFLGCFTDRIPRKSYKWFAIKVALPNRAILKQKYSSMFSIFVFLFPFSYVRNTYTICWLIFRMI